MSATAAPRMACHDDAVAGVAVHVRGCQRAGGQGHTSLYSRNSSALPESRRMRGSPVGAVTLYTVPSSASDSTPFTTPPSTEAFRGCGQQHLDVEAALRQHVVEEVEVPLSTDTRRGVRPTRVRVPRDEMGRRLPGEAQLGHPVVRGGDVARNGQVDGGRQTLSRGGSEVERVELLRIEQLGIARGLLVVVLRAHVATSSGSVSITSSLAKTSST